jgi:hypothetical protein
MWWHDIQSFCVLAVVPVREEGRRKAVDSREREKKKKEIK